MSAITYTHENGIATITMDHPPQNRLGAEISEGLTPAIMDLLSRTDTRALLLNAKGPDFSFGGDITLWKDVTSEQFGGQLKEMIAALGVFEDFPFPTVVAVQGHCRGGGFELALRADIIVAADNAKFGHPDATLGAFTYLGGVQRVADRVGRTRAMEWAYTAEMIEADRAVELGLINQAVPLSELESAADAWVQKLASGATQSHAAHKKLLREWSTSGVKAADDLIPEMAVLSHGSADLQDNLDEAIAAFKEGRERPQFKFKGK